MGEATTDFTDLTYFLPRSRKSLAVMTAWQKPIAVAAIKRSATPHRATSTRSSAPWRPIVAAAPGHVRLHYYGEGMAMMARLSNGRL
jgi:hypothetical protein